MLTVSAMCQNCLCRMFNKSQSIWNVHIPNWTDEIADLSQEAINIALLTVPGSEKLHIQKVFVLLHQKTWCHVLTHCEELAVANTRLDGCYTDDLTFKIPFPGVLLATSLTTASCQDMQEGDWKTGERHLDARASAKAILQFPHCLTSYYLQALCLEKRHMKQ